MTLNPSTATKYKVENSAYPKIPKREAIAICFLVRMIQDGRKRRRKIQIKSAAREKRKARSSPTERSFSKAILPKTPKKPKPTLAMEISRVPRRCGFSFFMIYFAFFTRRRDAGLAVRFVTRPGVFFLAPANAVAPERPL
ncbi:hypothetical protein D3C87_1512270 [compost metagenome]